MSADGHPILEVQRLDTVLDQLRHRRAGLPERAAVADAQGRITELERRRAAALDARRSPAREQKRLEDELATLEERIDQLDRQLYGGSVTSPKEAIAFEAELRSLREHRSGLEDRVLAGLDRLEPIDVALAELDGERSALDQVVAEATARLSAAEAGVDAEIDATTAERDRAAEAVEADVLRDYAALRPGFGASTVVRFDGSRCVGCPLAMPAVEVDRIRRAPAGSVLSCSECGRIVLR